MKRILLLAGLTLLALVCSFLWYSRVHAPVTGQASVTLTSPDGDTRTINVEIADDFPEQQRGLMDREHLDSGGGMLFVFDEDRPLTFWMKHTKIPLDIFFFDGRGLFVSRMSMDPCVADPCATYPSEGPARFALEVNRGEAVTAAVGTGWRVEIP